MQVFKALKYMHSAELLHRDIKVRLSQIMLFSGKGISLLAFILPPLCPSCITMKITGDTARPERASCRNVANFRISKHLPWLCSPVTCCSTASAW